MNTGDSSGLAVEPNRGARIAGDVTSMPRETTTNEKVGNAQTEGGIRGGHTTQIESAQISEAIAIGVAANVDDFMVSERQF